MKMLVWIFGCLTLTGAFTAVAVIMNTPFWGFLAASVFIFGYIALLYGIMVGVFD